MKDGVWALLLAAGESIRMGRPKPLLPWGGVSLIEWQVAQLKEAGAGEVVAVLGAAADEVRPFAERAGAHAVVNEHYREGRATSVRTGAAALPPDAEAVVILNVDQPRPAWVTRRLLAALRNSDALLAQPSYQGKGGHPLLIRGPLVPELGMVEDRTEGLRAVTRRHKAETLVIPFENACVIVDFNTPLEYERALASFETGDWAEGDGNFVTNR